VPSDIADDIQDIGEPRFGIMEEQKVRANSAFAIQLSEVKEENLNEK